VQATQPLQENLTFQGNRARRIKQNAIRSAFRLSFYVIVLACVTASRPAFAHSSREFSSAPASHPIDANKGPSELNHHISGWALIGVGLLVLTGFLSPRFETHRYLWPALFILAGLYLALWSDGEIWPRGNLNWLWLLHHDAEARQHKIYSLLLVAIGVIEYARIRGSLARFWRTWAFPLLAVMGAGMLLLHDHTGGSGARSPEAEAYLVNPALDVDGKPRAANAANNDGDNSPGQHHPLQASSESSMTAAPMDHGAMLMDPSPMTLAVSTGDSVSGFHHHFMTDSMLRVERQHMWFLIVGLAIGLFKFISDGEFFRHRMVPYMWPTCMLLLGFLLVLYRE